MAIASYRTAAGASRYCRDLVRMHPDCRFAPVPNNTFGYWVLVTMPDGRTAFAARRPRHFGRDAKTTPNAS